MSPAPAPSPVAPTIIDPENDQWEWIHDGVRWWVGCPPSMTQGQIMDTWGPDYERKEDEKEGKEGEGDEKKDEKTADKEEVEAAATVDEKEKDKEKGDDAKKEEEAKAETDAKKEEEAKAAETDAKKEEEVKAEETDAKKEEVKAEETDAKKGKEAKAEAKEDPKEKEKEKDLPSSSKRPGDPADHDKAKKLKKDKEAGVSWKPLTQRGYYDFVDSCNGCGRQVHDPPEEHLQQKAQQETKTEMQLIWKPCSKLGVQVFSGHFARQVLPEQLLMPELIDYVINYVAGSWERVPAGTPVYVVKIMKNIQELVDNWGMMSPVDMDYWVLQARQAY